MNADRMTETTAGTVGMAGTSPGIDALIESVADGLPVDWEAIGNQVDGKDQRALGNLHLVAGVASAFAKATADKATDDIAETVHWSDATRTDQPARWGHLVLIEKIGEGAFGEVYRARDPWLDWEVALKLLKRDLANRIPASRLIAEARTLARVRHPNVVTVHGADIHDGRVGLWMELVRGRTLADMLSAQGPFSANEAAVIGQEICRALAAVHAAGIVHRDVKAQNVMRESGGRLVLMDFGAGGTPVYLAPEVLIGNEATVASDVYAVGVLLYHLVTGRYPCALGSVNELASAHANGARLRLSEARPDLPEPFAALVERALDPDPSKRFSTAGQMREALAPLVTSAPVTPSAEKGTRTRRTSIVTLAAAATLVLATSLGWWWSSNTTFATPIEIVAVLPFENVSENPDEAHLATGVTMELTARLGELSALRVVPWTFTRRFRSPARTLADVVNATAADAVVEGSVQVLSGSGPDPARRSVRIRVQLYRASTGSLLWTEAYERDLSDLLAVQSDIAQAIARHVNVIVERREAVRLGQTHRVAQDAMEAYLKARELLEGKNDIRGALELFRAATVRDRTFAEAFVGLAWCQVLESAFLAAVPAPLALQRALAASGRAIEIDPTMPEAFAVRGFANLALAWNWPAAQADYDRAQALGPNNAAVFDSYSNYLTIRGRHDEAIAAARRAEERAPLSAAYGRKVAWALYMARRYGEATAQLQKVLAIEPEYLPARTLLGRVYLLQGQHAEAIAEFEKTSWTSMLVAAHARAGRVDRALRLLETLPGAAFAEATARQADVSRPPTPYDLAIANAEVGRFAEAVTELERAFRTRDASLAHIAVDPLLDSLRASPTFVDLVKRMSLE